MTPELAYFLKINVGIAIFYAFYRLFFYKDTFFHWRRTALLCFFGISLLYPLLNLQEWIKAHEPMVAMADLYAMTVLPEVTLDSTNVSNTGIDWLNIVRSTLFLIYWGGVAIFSLRFLIQFVSILRLRIHCKVQWIQGMRIYTLNKKSGPFSFFHWIFIHPDSHTDEELNEILTHELTHARQWHSVDVLVSEWMCMVCWFNPFAWLMKREIRNNLEYMADNQVIRTGHDYKIYQYHLLGLAHHKAAATLYNSFNVLPLKKRITMMNKKRTKEIGRTKYLMFFPLAALLMIVSNIEAVARTTGNFAKEVIQVIEQEKEVSSIPDSPSVLPEQEKLVEYKGVILDENGKGLTEATIIPKIKKDGQIDSFKKYETKTDVNGAFSFKAIEGINVLDITANGLSASFSIKEQNRNNISLSLKGLSKTYNQSDEEDVFDVVEQMPEYPGGIDALMKFLASNVRYPTIAQEKKITGRVIVKFIVEKDGSTSNYAILRSADPYLDAEAIRVLSTMSKWIPGKQKGKTVRVHYTVPVAFKLEDSKREEVKEPQLSEIVVVGYAPREVAEVGEVFEKVEEMPKFPGGTEGLMNFLARNIKYPIDAQQSKTQGRVIVQMTVDKEGRIVNPKIVRGVSTTLDAEAIRVVSLMPNWEPGKQKGQTVAVRYTIPIMFRLQ